MWTREYSKFFPNVSAEEIWEIWIDVNNWYKWHDDLEYCKMKGKFELNNHFILKPKGAPSVKIILTEINEGKSFTDCTKFFGAKMFDTHSIEKKEGGVLLTNTLTVTGPLRWLWVRLVAKNISDTVPEEIESLIHLAKEKGS